MNDNDINEIILNDEDTNSNASVEMIEIYELDTEDNDSSSDNDRSEVHLARLEMRLSVFRELLSLRCIKIKNLCAHHQEEVLRIPKHPQLAKFA